MEVNEEQIFFLRSIMNCDCTTIQNFLDRQVKRGLFDGPNIQIGKYCYDFGRHSDEQYRQLPFDTFELVALEEYDDGFIWDYIEILVANDDPGLETDEQLFIDSHLGDHDLWDEDLVEYRSLFKTGDGLRYIRATLVGKFESGANRMIEEVQAFIENHEIMEEEARLTADEE